MQENLDKIKQEENNKGKRKVLLHIYKQIEI